MNFREGTFKGRGIVGSEQLVDSNTGTPGLAIDIDIPELEGAMTSTLYLTATSVQIALDTLHALGWKGRGIQDLGDLSGIGDNEVNVRVFQDRYRDRDGAEKSLWKCQVMTRGGRVTFEKKLDKATWLARVKLAVGNAGGGGGTVGGSGGGGGQTSEPPPFIGDATNEGSREAWHK